MENYGVTENCTEFCMENYGVYGKLWSVRKTYGVLYGKL